MNLLEIIIAITSTVYGGSSSWGVGGGAMNVSLKKTDSYEMSHRSSQLQALVNTIMNLRVK
jgi:hypothetical protein